MAVDRKQFINKVDTGIKANKDYKKFYINYKLDGKIKQKVLDFNSKDWDKRTRISQAKAELINLKSKQIDDSIDFTENSTLNKVANTYFELVCTDTKWTKELKSVYNLYCCDNIGKKKIKDIRKVHIDQLKKDMATSGQSERTKAGCSPRTIKKVLVECLKPILTYAVENKALEDIPTIKAPKQNRQKKTIDDGGKKLSLLYTAIFKLYKDDGFYRALFLFALYGRRWNEIRTISWSDIDIVNSKYTIKAKNNKIGQDQTYGLPEPIKEALNDILDDKVGLVFKSPVTGKELHPPKKQLQKIKDEVDMPELTMHLFRHILVTAMGEVGTAATILSASLGHTNLDTVNQFYLSANHEKSSNQANTTIDKLVSNKIQ